MSWGYGPYPPEPEDCTIQCCALELEWRVNVSGQGEIEGVEVWGPRDEDLDVETIREEVEHRWPALAAVVDEHAGAGTDALGRALLEHEEVRDHVGATAMAVWQEEMAF